MPGSVEHAKVAALMLPRIEDSDSPFLNRDEVRELTRWMDIEKVSGIDFGRATAMVHLGILIGTVMHLMIDTEMLPQTITLWQRYRNEGLLGDVLPPDSDAGFPWR